MRNENIEAFTGTFAMDGSGIKNLNINNLYDLTEKILNHESWRREVRGITLAIQVKEPTDVLALRNEFEKRAFASSDPLEAATAAATAAGEEKKRSAYTDTFAKDVMRKLTTKPNEVDSREKKLNTLISYCDKNEPELTAASSLTFDSKGKAHPELIANLYVALKSLNLDSPESCRNTTTALENVLNNLNSLKEHKDSSTLGQAFSAVRSLAGK